MFSWIEWVFKAWVSIKPARLKHSVLRGKKKEKKKKKKSEEKKLAAARDWVACSRKWISRRNQRCGARGNKHSTDKARGERRPEKGLSSEAR